MDNLINSLVSQAASGGGTAGNANVIDKLTQQILATSDPTKWTGQGKGSAQANAADMARIIAETGATDISQFGQITKQVPVTSTDENGNTYDTGETKTVTTYGNKATGQEVPNTYSERQTGNAFGGTFSGKGNTGYRVEFDPSGKPIFYTTGASSSDVPSWVKPALILGAAYFGLDAAGLLGSGAGGGADLPIIRRDLLREDEGFTLLEYDEGQPTYKIVITYGTFDSLMLEDGTIFLRQEDDGKLIIQAN